MKQAGRQEQIGGGFVARLCFSLATRTIFLLSKYKQVVAQNDEYVGWTLPTLPYFLRFVYQVLLHNITHNFTASGVSAVSFSSLGRANVEEHPSVPTAGCGTRWFK